jgi:CRISPR-associated endoribonuclease Cas6
MRLKIIMTRIHDSVLLPINYNYPLSAALFRIFAKGDAAYAEFLHEKGYGKKDKGFKLFTFSQLNVPFKIEGDRLRLLSDEVSFDIAIYLPQALERFVKGLFQSEHIDIADKKSKVSFKVKSVESLADPLQAYKENELINIAVKPLSPTVAGLQNEKGNYDFLAPEDARFVESLIYNWRSKIEACYDKETAVATLLMMEVKLKGYTPKSRLITIKAATEQETKIRGWMNFELDVTAQKRFVELLLNAGLGIYNSVIGGGYLEVVELNRIFKNSL